MSPTAELPRQATIAAIVGTILPAYPALDAGVRRTVEADITAYVCGQVAAMPGFLRIPYRLALVAFELLPIVRYGRRFAALPVADRATCVRRWDTASLGAFRDVMKVIRSTALLAYFDHPLVTASLSAERAATVAPSAPRAANE